VRTAVGSFVRKFLGKVLRQFLGFGLSDQLFVMHYPWGKVRYPLFGYIA
jgi:hypothetical protein